MNRLLFVVVIVLLCAGALVALLTWKSGSSSAAPLEMPAFTPEVLTAGGALFANACAACHGETGVGSANGPGLNASMLTWERSRAQLEQFIRQGRGGMPAVAADWSDADVSAVLTYLTRLWTDDQIEEHVRISRGEGRR